MLDPRLITLFGFWVSPPSEHSKEHWASQSTIHNQRAGTLTELCAALTTLTTHTIANRGKAMQR